MLFCIKLHFSTFYVLALFNEIHVSNLADNHLETAISNACASDRLLGMYSCEISFEVFEIRKPVLLRDTLLRDYSVLSRHFAPSPSLEDEFDCAAPFGELGSFALLGGLGDLVQIFKSSTVILSQKGGGSTQNKLLKAIFLMSFIYTNVFLLCVKPTQEKIKGSY